SQSANLATINKDFAPGTSADFEAAAPIRLSGSPTTTTTVSCTPADALTYQATTTCTATVMDQAATDATQPMGSISWAAVGGTLSTMACTLVGSGPSSSTCSVTFTATNPGPGSVSATYAGNMTHQGSDGSATLTINPAPLTISVQDESRAFGAGDPAFAVDYSGFVGGEDASVLGGVLSCVTNATAASAPGAYSIDCSGLVSGNYEITWQAGTLSVGLSQPTITSGTPPALTYGEQLPADPTGGDSASVPGTFSYQPLPGSFPNAGTVTVHVTFTPDDPGYAPVEYDVQVQVGRAPLTITAHDAERAQGEPNPELTAGYEGFVNGDDPGDLSGNLTCSTAAGLDSTPAAYAISCSGPSSDNYDINFVNGQLTVLEPATPLDTTAPSASDLRVSFITGSVITAKGFVPVRTSWSSTDDTGIASTTLQRALAGGKYVSVKTATCPSLLQSFDASFDASLKPRVMFRERAQSSDAAGNPSAWTSADPFVITDFQIHSTALTYTGTWKSKYGRSFWNGGHRFSAKSSNSVTLTTVGSSFAFVSSLGPNMGQVRVSVDGTPVETIDLYSPTTVERYVAWSRSFDAVGTHTVTIEVLGTRNSLSTDTRVTLDAFTTIGPSVVGGPPISG
ncbi:MAG TPA: MBG domain-containing protein, partial [Candidatus Limnocylindrales bacterium]|nr:MBG domain-containing protein [Candidatus Limnocylindrales bacterium]